jgi:NAD(P)-dependent dehydrogenase (short-subunit alcohol dehydrogenase family)
MRSALVTGTSTGIGLEIALHFARKGYRVFAGARKPDVVQKHPNLVPVRLDVDQDASVRECVASVGPVDVLVNNAGIGIAGTIEMMPMEKVRALFETNFFGAVRMVQAVLPSMRERRTGTVVNVSSGMGRMTLGGHGYYAATKHALAAVSDTLAEEGRPFGIRVAVIEPGVVLTPIWNKVEDVMPPGHPYQHVMSRLMQVFGAQLEGATLPDVVAQITYDAVESGAEKLRYPAGADAEVFAATRDRLGAADWVNMMAIEDDAEFFAAAEKAFGVDLYHPPSLNQRRAKSAAN